MSIETNQNNLAMKSLYRPEIDGLRAFAVVAVIINHFNKKYFQMDTLALIFFLLSQDLS